MSSSVTRPPASRSDIATASAAQHATSDEPASFRTGFFRFGRFGFGARAGTGGPNPDCRAAP